VDRRVENKMKRYLKYSKSYHKAIACFAITLATIIWITAVGIALAATSPSAPVLGLDRTTATVTLFFVPIPMGVALLLGINYWFVAAGRGIGWYGVLYAEEEDKSAIA
jgi:hypothetical protein